MPRKKWTPNEDVTDALLKFREKRKWQLALRRYIIEKNSSENYAPYFGLRIEDLRKWIAIQFTAGQHWDNFGTAWQFDHVIPVSYFDFSQKEDLTLCWNFININIRPIEEGKTGPAQVDLLAAKEYFIKLQQRTGYHICQRMVDKIA